MVPTKSLFSGEMVMLAPESQMTGKAAFELIIDRNRLGATGSSATLSRMLGGVACAM